MVSILVDEAYAFDYLAILLIKYDFSKNELILTKAEECTEHIQSQIGKKKMEEILSSDEFKKLLDQFNHILRSFHQNISCFGAQRYTDRLRLFSCLYYTMVQAFFQYRNFAKEIGNSQFLCMHLALRKRRQSVHLA